MPRSRVLLILSLLAAAISSFSAAAEKPVPLLLPEAALPPKHTAIVFGQKIAYYELGTGPTLVLVHGFASQARFDWGNVLLPLAKHHHVLALDQIGFGSSDKPFIDYSIQTYVDFLGEFLRTQHITKFDLAGESLGGWISALYTIESLNPDATKNTGPYALPKPSRLILEDAAGMAALPHIEGGYPVKGTLAEAHGVAIVFHDKSRVTEEFVRENFTMNLAANDGFTERSIWGSPKLASEVVKDRLRQITIPTLIVWGGNDEIVPLEQGNAYHAGIPGSTLIVIPDCGHAPSIEKPEKFLEAVKDFLK